jgi:hypothetical protein
VIKPLQFCALVTAVGSTLMVMGTLAVPCVTPLLGPAVNHGCRANARPSRTLGLSVPHTAEAATVNGTELAVELKLMVCGIGSTRGV